MNRQAIVRVSVAVLVLGAALALSGCNGVVPGTGSVVLTVYNYNDPTKGSFDYTNVYVDNKISVSADIKAGQSASVRIEPGQHFLVYTFVYTPNTGTAGKTLHSGTASGDTFYVAQSATSYPWTSGPVWPNK